MCKYFFYKILRNLYLFVRPDGEKCNVQKCWNVVNRFLFTNLMFLIISVKKKRKCTREEYYFVKIIVRAYALLEIVIRVIIFKFARIIQSKLSLIYH